MAPKLNSHCWYDMKLAAAKNPDLTRSKRKERVYLRIQINKRTTETRSG